MMKYVICFTAGMWFACITSYALEHLEDGGIPAVVGAVVGVFATLGLSAWVVAYFLYAGLLRLLGSY